ncbi:tetratricopeptide repeat protein [Paraburkholderia sediminicola]|uniref:Tetratricopeptide repeat protein n=1 Tax=Paraburkholderia rhynchosiae TaxID=487049 RepID=A0ACC7NMS6_9BURK
MEKGNFPAATECLNEAARLEPTNPDIMNNFGDLYYRQRHYAKASDAFRRALALRPGHQAASNNLALSEQAVAQDLATRGEFSAASTHFETALRYAPDNINLLVAVALNQRHMGANDVAITWLRKACSLAEADASADGVFLQRQLAGVRYTLGTTLLREGLYGEGWPLYEFRREAHNDVPACPPGLQQWDGNAVPIGSRILVECEQGLGDTIQFCRFVQRLGTWFDGITLAVQKPLVDLLARSFGPDIAVTGTMPPARRPLTHYASLPSLPALLGVRLDDLKPDTRYLLPDENRIAAWQTRERSLSPALRVGLTWGSSSGLADNTMRNVAFDDIRILLDIPGVQWFSLQKDADPALFEGTSLINWMNDVHDFHDTAALAKTLDLVISVDTSVVHLAGAVGVTSWLLNRYTGEWRWLAQSGQCPWYPSIEVFHQERYGDWRPTLARVRERLHQKAGQTAA